MFVFFYTGADMQRHVATDSQTPILIRNAMRANHVYIMFAALLNFALGLYLVDVKESWRRGLRCLGSIIIILGAPGLVGTYFFEAARGSPTRPVMTWIIIGLFAATIIHGISRLAEEEIIPDGRA